MSTVKAKKKSNLYAHEYRVAFMFVILPVIGFLVFSLLPFLYSIYASLTDWNGLGRMNFIGTENFQKLLRDPYFYKTMWNTLFLMLGIPIGLILSFALASALSRGIKGTTIFRTIYYIPVISSLAAISILWQWAYNGDFGLVNQVLDIFGIDGPNWLQNPTTVKPAIILMTVWKGLGYSMLLYLAAIQSVPKTFYEAAELDGATAFQKFRNITWPMVKPVTFFLIVTNIIGGSQIFTEINIMTPTGGPEYSSATIVWYIWQKAFKNWQMGYACSMALVLAVIVFAVTALQFWINSRSEYTVD
ncbi:multiple sugar transport system permease protein [Streptococcus equinus]|uniref:Multiple sugar transport system permease protein n=1 Tax=Streptococcus equinus TaxID=1335 RepID=A0A1H1AMN2_STREI|nr:sugar ABC transporter permease [Streptococcus equinus]SDQ40927.1 multiple sugar transport system permease protein [Streptococcus equinus]